MKNAFFPLRLFKILFLTLCFPALASAQDTSVHKPFRAPRNASTGAVIKPYRWLETTNGNARHDRGFFFLDQTAALIGADKVAAGFSLPQAFDGNGVVMGVTDIGFDFTHPSFASVKISRFWDLLSCDTIGSTLISGRDYTDENEIRALQCSFDGRKQMHGTHVLGIAAGIGAPEIFSQPLYRGIAPGAELVLVNNVLSNNRDQLDERLRKKLEGEYFLPLEFQYMFDYAASVGKPCVVNVSSGSRESFGDDFDVYNKLYSELTGPGRIIVASAGNEGQRMVSMHKTQNQESAGARLLLKGSTGAYLFYQTADETKQAANETNQTSNESNQTSSERFSTPELQIFYSPDDGSTKLLLEPEHYEILDTISDYDGTPVRYIIFADDLQSKGRSHIYVKMSGAGAASVFTQGAEFLNSKQDDGWNDATNSYATYFPGCYDDVICVAAMTYRNEIINYKGDVTGWENGELGYNASFTSHGPRIDGHMKPDIAAPGSYIISSFNSFYEEENPTDYYISGIKEHFQHNGRTYAWMAESGTSMSAPVVTGIIALWLQAKPDLTPQDIKAVFARTARHPDPTLEYPNPIYGWGEIDAYAGLLDILGFSGINTISKSLPQRVKFKVAGHSVSAFAADNGAPIELRIYDTAGQLQRNGMLVPGIYAVETISTNPQYKGSTLVRIK